MKFVTVIDGLLCEGGKRREMERSMTARKKLDDFVTYIRFLLVTKFVSESL